MRQRLIGHVDLLLLFVLGEGPAHGYALVEAIRERTAGEFDLPDGTVYPSLYRLERRRLVTSRWEQVAGRRRRVYRLTSSGRRSLETQRAEWRSFASAVESVLA